MIIQNSETESKQRAAQQAASERLAVTSIRADELSLSGVSLVKEPSGGWTLQGTLTNNSKFNLARLEFLVTMQDCRQSCKIIGQETISTASADYLDRRPLAGC